MKLTIEGTPEAIKKVLQAIVSSEEQKCVVCGESGNLELENGTFVCDTCAQIQGELDPEGI